ncbi:MAG: type II secretion system F family protein [Natrialbaceae archaeon]|nr:type II secretion system F family protein [Natrialbaceae archaeon]
MTVEQPTRSSAGPHTELDEADSHAYRAHFGHIRGLIKFHSERFGGFDRVLDQADIPATYDQYLQASVRNAARTAGLSSAVLAAGAVVLAVLQDGTTAGTLAVWLLGAAAGGLVTGLLLLGLSMGYPWLRLRRRRREIDATAPHAILFMAALSRSGQGIIELFEAVAAADDIHGETAREIQAIRTDIRHCSTDPIEAIQTAQLGTPSQLFAEFLEDLINVLEAGGDVQTFLTNASDDHIDRLAEKRQEFNQTLEVLAEIYFAIGVAGPIFLVTVLVVMSFSGANTLLYVQLLTYVGIPLGFVVAVGAVRWLNPVTRVEATLHEPGDAARQPTDPATDTERTYARWSRSQQRRALLTHPLETMRTRPATTLLVTIPGTLGLGLTLWVMNVVRLDGLTGLWTPEGTAALALLALVPAGGLSLAFELERRRLQTINRRFPEVLEAIASANANGIGLVSSMELVASGFPTSLGDAFQRVVQDIRLTNDLESSLVHLGNRLGATRVSRVIKLLIEGTKATGDLAPVLAVAADAVSQEYRIERSQRTLMDQYVVILVIGLIVYLLLFVIMTAVFFTEISAIPAIESELDVGLSISPRPCQSRPSRRRCFTRS